MSYTRSYLHAIVLGGVIACMLMLAINNNIAAGLGIMGSLAIVRFRTSMRDPRDMIFVFASMAAGIACGLGAHFVAILGTAVFCVTNAVVTMLNIGSQRQFDGLLRFLAPANVMPFLFENFNHQP